MKQCTPVIIALFLFCSINLKSQTCLPGGITFNSQADVNAFATNYPGCTEIMGNIYIQGSISSLSPLNNIIKINGNLAIVNSTINQANIFPNLQHVTNSLFISNTSFTGLSGFDNLTTVNNKIQIFSNDNLATLNGFNALTKTDSITIGNQIDIQNAFTQIDTLKLLKILSYSPTGAAMQVSGVNSFNALTKCDNVEIEGLLNSNINFLSNLDSVKSSIFIYNSPNLTSLSGLSSISFAKTMYIGGCTALVNLNLPLSFQTKNLTIGGNPLLTSLSGLPPITQLDELNISNNNALTSLEGLNDLRTVKSIFYILDNPVLNDISALDNLKIIGSTLNIYGNPNLNECCKIASLVTKNRILGEVQVNNNGPECSSLLDILSIYCLDSDEDEIVDLDDNCPDDFNEDQEDFDNDSVGDACDNCPLISNSDQADANNDGVGDVCQSVSGVGALQISSDVYVDNSLRGVVLKSSDGSCFRVKINNKGRISAKKITCP